jgi:hypothetical protein
VAVKGPAAWFDCGPVFAPVLAMEKRGSLREEFCDKANRMSNNPAIMPALITRKGRKYAEKRYLRRSYISASK